jgi:hypothetical protein
MTSFLCNWIVIMEIDLIKQGAVVIIWYLDFQLPVQLVPITTNGMSSKSVHGEVHSIQHSLQINMSPYSDTLSWFRDNQLTPWCCILSNHGSNQRSTALKESTLTITPQMWLQNQEYCFFKTYESCMFNAVHNFFSLTSTSFGIWYYSLLKKESMWPWSYGS